MRLQVCGVTCCGIINFEQHCTSKKHLRKAAGVAHATVSSDSLLALPQEGTSVGAPGSESGNGTTYVGHQAQCRTYCKQVHFATTCQLPLHQDLCKKAPPGFVYVNPSLLSAVLDDPGVTNAVLMMTKRAHDNSPP